MKSYTNIKLLGRDEKWAGIEDFNCLYYISNYGRVYSVRSKRTLKGGIRGGYRSLNLSGVTHGLGTKSCYFHRLVAKYFVDGYKDGLEINHKDGIKGNNHYKNLEWVTKSENKLHAIRMGLAVMTDKIKEKIRDGNSSTVTRVSKEGKKTFYKNMRHACESLGIAHSTVHCYIHGVCKPRDGSTWHWEGLNNG